MAAAWNHGFTATQHTQLSAIYLAAAVLSYVQLQLFAFLIKKALSLNNLYPYIKGQSSETCTLKGCPYWRHYSNTYLDVSL